MASEVWGVVALPLMISQLGIIDRDQAHASPYVGSQAHAGPYVGSQVHASPYVDSQAHASPCKQFAGTVLGGKVAAPKGPETALESA